MSDKVISDKINRLQQIIGLILLIIIFKTWHLSVIQIEEKKQEADRPQRKTLQAHANRGAICDRYNIPLAINRIKYNACVYYAHIRQLPSVRWEKDEQGHKVKVFPRKAHIKKIALSLGNELQMDPDRIEDLIHSKASLLPHVPFVIKENIAEKDYYKLRMLERNLAGVHAEITSERSYPQGSIASDVLGYMGAISQEKYMSIAKEISSIETLLKKDLSFEKADLPKEYNFNKAKKRLLFLKELAYSVNDLVGKSGLEAQYEEMLRGIHGKKVYAVNTKGTFLKELPSSKKAINGTKLTTSISSKLQSFAEQLLAKEEKQREGKSLKYDKKNRKIEKLKQPFIKGGAIIVMDPKNGEILTLASYPRFNPNDYISTSNLKLKKEKQKKILKWLEQPLHIANIFDGKEPLTKELFNEKKEFFEEKHNLSLEYFLQLILPENSDILQSLEKIKNVKNAIELEENIETLLFYAKTKELSKILDSIFPESEKNTPTDERLSNKEKASILQNIYANEESIGPIISNLQFYLQGTKSNKDKMLTIDLLRIIIFNPAFSDDLIKKVGEISLSDYWKITKAIISLEEQIKSTVYPVFSNSIFKKWKKENQKEFLKQKREEEKEKKVYSKPYLDYLDQIESLLFKEFWTQKKELFIASFLKDEELADNDISIYINSIKDLKNITKNTNAQKPWLVAFNFLKEQLASLDFDNTYSFIKTIRSFEELQRPLYGKYPSACKKSAGLEKSLAAAFYPKEGYGYGRSQAFRQSAPIGSIFKISIAYTALKKYYDTLLKMGKTPLHNLNPLTITDIIHCNRSTKENTVIVGYSEDNKPYPRYYKGGRLPKSSHPNIGKIDIISALGQSSNPYFSLLAGDFINSPEEILSDAQNFSFGQKTKIDLPGEIPGILPEDLQTNKTGLYSFAIGQHSLVVTPLQTAVMLSTIANGGEVVKPSLIKGKKETMKNIFFPPAVKNTIMEGLDYTLWGEKGNAKPSVIQKIKYNVPALEKFNLLKHRFIGKTSTAEIMHRPNINSTQAEKYKHIWFGGIYFEEEKNWNTPELVVIVYLKYGDGGKEAAPLAAEIVHKYLELKKQNSTNVASEF